MSPITGETPATSSCLHLTRGGPLISGETVVARTPKRKQSENCIYCSSSSQWSREHCVPRGLGSFSGHQILKGTICRNCNGSFKLSEEQFLRAGPQAFYRHMLGVSGRNVAAQPNPYYRGSAGAPPLEALFAHPETGIEVLWEIDPDTKQMVELSQVVFRQDDTLHHLVLPPDAVVTTEWIRDRLATRGTDMGAVEPVFVSAEPEAYEQLHVVLRQIFDVGLESVERDPKRRAGRVAVPVKVSVTDLYFRAAAKIAFHYAVHVFGGSFTGGEPCFKDIRSFIMTGCGNSEDFVSERNGQIVGNMGPNKTLSRWSHLVTAAKTDNGSMRAQMQFFIGPEYVPPITEVILSPHISKVIYPRAYGHVYSYYHDGPKDGHAGEVHEVSYGAAAARPR